MGALSRAAAIFALALALGIAPCHAREGADWRLHVREAAARFGLPEAWVLRVIAAESGGRTHLGGRPITSRAGAMGLMQVMPRTWASLRARHRLGPDPHDPRDNIFAGTAYLREMYDRFGYPGLFAAYNAGPGRYGEYLARGRPLPRETRDYVAKITRVAPVPGIATPGITHGQRLAAAASDPIFLSRREPDGGAPMSMAAQPDQGSETVPMLRRGEKAADAAPAVETLFLLRQPEPIGER